MKKELKKLNNILKANGLSSQQRLCYKLYLAVVLLGNRIPEVSKYYKIPESKVTSAVTFCAVNLKKDKAFYLLMHRVFKAYKSQQQLKFVA